MVVYQSPSLAYPPCEAGASVTAAATGVSLRADCIAPLELSGPDPIPVKTGEPVHLTWVPAAQGAASRVRIKLDVSHHGGSKGEIDCDERTIECWKHGSAFDLATGEPLTLPATRPVPVYTARIEGDDIVVVLP